MISKELLYKQKVDRVQQGTALIKMGIKYTRNGEMKKKLERELEELNNVKYW